MSWSLTLPQALRLTECVFAWSLAIQTLEYLRMRDASVDTLGGELALGVSVIMPATVYGSQLAFGRRSSA